MDTNVVVVELTKLELQPNDVLAVKVNRQLNTEEIQQLSEAINAVLPKDVKAVIMSTEYEIEVIRKV